MTCNCLNQAKDKLHEILTKDMPEGSELGGTFDGTGWDNEVLSLGNPSGVFVMLKYKVAWRAPKKNGDLAKNFTRKECSLKMTYCPLCGKAFDEEK